MKVLTILQRAQERLGAFALSAYASQLTLGLVTAIFPALLVILTVVGFWIDPALITQEVLSILSGVVPADILDLVDKNLKATLPSQSVGVLSLGFGVLIYLAIQLLRQTMYVLNLAYDVDEDRNFFKRIALLLVLMFSGIFVLVIMIQFLFITTGLVAWLNYWVGFTVIPLEVLTWRWPAVLLLMIVMVTLSYYFIPNHQHRQLRQHISGALFFTIGWLVMTYGFNIYVSNFADYNATYGVLGTIILFIFYLQLNAYLYLLGAILNAGVIQATEKSWWDKVQSVLFTERS